MADHMAIRSIAFPRLISRMCSAACLRCDESLSVTKSKSSLSESLLSSSHSDSFINLILHKASPMQNSESNAFHWQGPSLIAEANPWMRYVGKRQASPGPASQIVITGKNRTTSINTEKRKPEDKTRIIRGATR